MSATLQEELSERVRRDGFAVVRGVLDEQALSSFEESLAAAESGEGVLRRGGVYAIRNLFSATFAACFTSSRTTPRREKGDEIISIYRSMRRPVPEYGNANPDGSYTVETFKTTPRRMEFDSGGLFKDEVPDVSSLVAHTYEFDARAGQRLNVSVSSRWGAAVLDLYREGTEGRAPLLYGKRKAAYVPLSAGKYRIRVRSRSGEVGYVLRAELK